jgi:hypothetical protein
MPAVANDRADMAARCGRRRDPIGLLNGCGAAGFRSRVDGLNLVRVWIIAGRVRMRRGHEREHLASHGHDSKDHSRRSSPPGRPPFHRPVRVGGGEGRPGGDSLPEAPPSPDQALAFGRFIQPREPTTAGWAKASASDVACVLRRREELGSHRLRGAQGNGAPGLIRPFPAIQATSGGATGTPKGRRSALQRCPSATP